MSIDRPFLYIDSLNLQLGRFSLKDISLSCRKVEYHILMGPSGSGKSTLMKSLLGFHKIQGGSIFLDNRNITNTLPEARRMGYLPQNYALFPHLDVEQNIGFALREKRLSEKERLNTVNRIFDILKIEKLRKRNVKNLSGGERQKVALGRALGAQPDVILLDEPFSSIDEAGKRGLWFELKRIVSEFGITAVHITHNLEEAYTLGENLSVLINGRLVQSGHKSDIFERPASRLVADYLNYVNIFEGRAIKTAHGTRIETENLNVNVDREVPEGKKINICIRQQDIKIVQEDKPLKKSLKKNVFPGTITDLLPLPESCIMYFKFNNSNRKYDLELRFPIHIKDRHNLYPGKKVRVAFWEPTIIIFE